MAEIKEIRADEFDPKEFIREKIDEISKRVGGLSHKLQERITFKILWSIRDVVSVTFNTTPKPPSTIEAI